MRVLTVSEKSEEYGRQVEQKLKEAGLRSTGDYRSEKLGAKVRDGQLQLVPYMFVVGERDKEAGTVTVRDRIESKDLGAMPLAEAIAKLQAEIDAKTVRQVAASDSAGFTSAGAENEY